MAARPRRGLNIRGPGYIQNLDVETLELNGRALSFQRPGREYFVATDGGSDSYGGHDWNLPFATVAQAFSGMVSGDTLYVTGDVREQLLAPLGVQGGRVIGAVAGMTRHDDGVRWRSPASPTANTPLLTLREQGWEVENILFVPASGISGVRIRRAEDATYPDGSHAIIAGCKFIGDDASPVGVGIEDHGGSHHNLIDGCEFMGLVDAIKHTTGAGIASPLRWQIRRSWFATNTNHLVLPGNQCRIEENAFDPATVVINTSGGTEGKNYVLRNQFSDAEADIDNAHGYTGHAADVWRNYSANTAADTVGVPGA